MNLAFYYPDKQKKLPKKMKVVAGKVIELSTQRYYTTMDIPDLLRDIMDTILKVNEKK